MTTEKDMNARLYKAIHLAEEQARDSALWFASMTAAEAYLQQELRRLHEVIEGKSSEECAHAVLEGKSSNIYESAVRGRQDFRTAYRRERERASELLSLLREARQRIPDWETNAELLARIDARTTGDAR